MCNKYQKWGDAVIDTMHWIHYVSKNTFMIDASCDDVCSKVCGLLSHFNLLEVKKKRETKKK